MHLALIFARTRNLGIYRFTQLLLVLILPWLVMISLGGFRQSSAVVVWAALSSLGALLIDDLRGTLFWRATADEDGHYCLAVAL
jgi:adenylate cyclase